MAANRSALVCTVGLAVFCLGVSHARASDWALAIHGGAGGIPKDLPATELHRKEILGAAAAEVIEELKAAGGDGGMIAMDATGKVAMPYSSATMLRGQVSSKQPANVVVETSSHR